MSEPNGNSLIDLSPNHVQQVVAAEHGGRNESFPPDIVHKIYKYGAHLGHRVECVPKASRCMDLARADILKSEQHAHSFRSGTVYIAGSLTGSRGRFKRSWHAPEGGVWMVVALVNTMLPKYAHLLPLAVGAACCETARHFGVRAHTKWVNDVHVEGKKLAGILIETMLGPVTKEEYILVGIGLNVNNTKFPEELAGISTSMRNFLSEDLDLSQVAAVLVAKNVWNYGMLCLQEETELAEMSGGAIGRACSVVQAWASLSDTVGRRVKYGYNVFSNPQFTAKVTGVNDNGALIMKLDDGSEIIEACGEIAYLD